MYEASSDLSGNVTAWSDTLPSDEPLDGEVGLVLPNASVGLRDTEYRPGMAGMVWHGMVVWHGGVSVNGACVCERVRVEHVHVSEEHVHVCVCVN